MCEFAQIELAHDPRMRNPAWLAGSGYSGGSEMPKTQARSNEAHDPVALAADLHYRAAEIAAADPAVAEIVRTAALDIENALAQRAANGHRTNLMPALRFARDS
jgi:hypothetical protein